MRNRVIERQCEARIVDIPSFKSKWNPNAGKYGYYDILFNNWVTVEGGKTSCIFEFRRNPLNPRFNEPTCF
jgi:hypothetical protein